VELSVSGSCPDESAVRAVLQGLSPTAGSDALPSITDHGSSYVVTVGVLSKTYADPPRDCAQRARVAAAFISLALVPDALPDTPAPTPAPAPTPTPTPAHTPLRALLDTRATGETSFSPALFVPGIAIAATVTQAAIGAQLGCGWESSASLPATGGGDILVERFPCAIGPRFRLSPEGSAVELAATPALVVGLLHVKGAGFAADYDATRLEVGARLALDLMLRLSRGARLAPVLGVQATYDATAYDVQVSPRGVVAHTPTWWVGASAGVSLDIPQ
jgi:hypothetical protein